jgi:hypothetical protein
MRALCLVAVPGLVFWPLLGALHPMYACSDWPSDEGGSLVNILDPWPACPTGSAAFLVPLMIVCAGALVAVSLARAMRTRD